MLLDVHLRKDATSLLFSNILWRWCKQNWGLCSTTVKSFNSGRLISSCWWLFLSWNLSVQTNGFNIESYVGVLSASWYLNWHALTELWCMHIFAVAWWLISLFIFLIHNTPSFSPWIMEWIFSKWLVHKLHCCSLFHTSQSCCVTSVHQKVSLVSGCFIAINFITIV